MYQEMQSFYERPKPFSCYTAHLLWTDPHISQRMLECHLDPTSDLASRRPETIDRIVEWIHARFDLNGKAVCDLGCGPGLYSLRMAQHGALVTGVDFSTRSIAHARSNSQDADGTIDYVELDYLEGPLPTGQDLVFLIYGDLCVLSPSQRRRLYEKVRLTLKPGGHFVFDVFSILQFEQRTEVATYGRRLMDGFWAAGDYFGFQNTFLYDDQKLALDRYLIVEPERTHEVYNWMQYFNPLDISEELNNHGFEVVRIVDVLTGRPWKEAPQEFVVIARA